MDRIDLFKGVRIKPSKDYFIQYISLGVEGKVEGIEKDNLVVVNGKRYDISAAISPSSFPNIPKYPFAKMEIPIRYIRAFRNI